MNKFKFFKLKKFYYDSMYPNQEYSHIFDFSYNSINFTMLLNRNEQDIMILYFVKVGTNEELSFEIDEKFSISTYTENELYNKLLAFFEIKYDPLNQFRPFNLFRYIDSNLKPRPFNSNDNRRSIVKLYKLNNPEAIYYRSMINWDNSKSGKRYSKENRDKVKKLLPSLFEIIKEKNISVQFTSISKDLKQEITDFTTDFKKKK